METSDIHIHHDLPKYENKIFMTAILLKAINTSTLKCSIVYTQQ